MNYANASATAPLRTCTPTCDPAKQRGSGPPVGAPFPPPPATSRLTDRKPQVRTAASGKTLRGPRSARVLLRVTALSPKLLSAEDGFALAPGQRRNHREECHDCHPRRARVELGDAESFRFLLRRDHPGVERSSQPGTALPLDRPPTPTSLETRTLPTLALMYGCSPAGLFPGPWFLIRSAGALCTRVCGPYLS